MLDIPDTWPRTEFSSFIDERSVRFGHGFILMYSTTDRQSFEEMQRFFDEIYGYSEAQNKPSVLVGNKVDLEEDRQVTTEEGKELAQKNECLFFEASAKTRVNVNEQFYELIREIRRIKALPPPVQRKQHRCIVM